MQIARANGVENLPIVTEAGGVIGTGTPVDTPLPPTPTIVPAPMDSDSADHPLANVTFDPSGTHILIYNGDVSTPDGDTQDWIEFTPYGAMIFASLECKGSDALQVEILEDKQPINETMKCGDWMKTIPVQAGQTYLIHLLALPSTDGLHYIQYTITIQTDSP